MLFMFILISSANTTNILMLDLNKLLIEKKSVDRFRDEYYKDISTF